MSPLLERLRADLQSARKAQDKPRLLVLGTVLADISNREIELKRALTDDDVVEVLRRGIKKRREAQEVFEKAQRSDLSSKERNEVEVLSGYMPTAVGEDEIRSAVRATIATGQSNLGAVMGRVMGQFKGRVDGGVVSAIVREELAKVS
jgi:uncharacterized protein YqeY